MNYTIVVPEGTTNHGNPQLLCTPARWYDYIMFIFANYLAHAATAVPTPGQDIEASICAVLLALMLPGSAVVRAVTVIFRRAASYQSDPLKCASRAGALCIVLKKPETGFWATYLAAGRPRKKKDDAELGQAETLQSREQTASNPVTPGSEAIDERGQEQKLESVDSQVAPVREDKKALRSDRLTYASWLRTRAEVETAGRASEEWDNPRLGYEPIPHGSRVHGEHWLHEDYYLALLPPTGLPDLKLDIPDLPSTTPEGSDSEGSQFRTRGPLISCSYNFVKFFIGLLQSILASITIYRARGNQIQQYGYAAFGLTVAPYATMSIINTLANLSTPEYNSVFVLRTPLLTQLENESKARFQGALNVVAVPAPPEGEPQGSSRPSILNQLGKRLDRLAFPTTNLPAGLGGFIQITSLLLSLIPLVIVGALSGFRNEQSTQMDRGFTMSWLILGIVYGAFQPMLALEEDMWAPEIGAHVASLLAVGQPFKAFRNRGRIFNSLPRRPNGIGMGMSFVLVFAAPVFGGMAIVGKMIHEFGVCSLLRE